MRHTLWKFGLALATALSVGVVALAVPQAQTEKPKPTIKREYAQAIVSVQGKDNFDSYCAVCHGKNAKGDGPAAPALKTPVADLTMLARKNGGKFNALAVEDTIRGAARDLPAHGTPDMPIWGPVFRSMQEDPHVLLLRLKNLVDYIGSIQVQ